MYNSMPSISRKAGEDASPCRCRTSGADAVLSHERSGHAGCPNHRPVAWISEAVLRFAALALVPVQAALESATCALTLLRLSCHESRPCAQNRRGRTSIC